jgi:LmbE family N-acetylglucosaminyl deacetylase
MGTLVCFHAHPDDESIATAGTMAKAAKAGHRVVLVVATGGEHGEIPDDLGPGETLIERRRRETECSATVIGIDRVVWLGYHDSGMTGWEQNSWPGAFMSADLDEAAGRLAAVLTEERADVLTVYDWHGGYGHPDHIRVHDVGHRAAELADVANVYESTMNRDFVMRQMAEAREAGMELPSPQDGDLDDPASWTDDGRPFGSAEAEITTAIDVSDFIDLKRTSMTCHASQVTDSGFFLSMPPDAFARAFGTEWYIHVGAAPGIREDRLAGLGGVAGPG